MGPGETLVAIAFAGVAIGVIIATTQIIQRFIAYKEAKVLAQSAPAAPAGMSATQQALEERVRVLERIVTERDHGLAAEIEALRDTPARPAGSLADYTSGSGVPLALEQIPEQERV